MIQFIVGHKEETEISEAAKEWFYNLVLNGKSGPFTCQTFNGETKAIVLTVKLTEQQELFG